MATLRDIGLAEPSTLTARLAAATITRNSTVQSQELMCIADPDSTTSSAIAKVINTNPGSTSWGLVVRVAGGASTATDLAVRALLPSTATDNPVTARLLTSSGGSLEGSTLIPGVGTLGLHVVDVRPRLQTAASTAGTDTGAVVVAGSTAAGTGSIYVSAFMVTSTLAGPVNCGFYSMGGGASTLLWPMTIWAEGGVMNISQAITSPGYLFATSTGSTLTFQVATTGAYRVAVTYSTGV